MIVMIITNQYNFHFQKVDFNEFTNYNMFINSIQSISRGIFNIVFETQTDFENIELLIINLYH